MTLCRRGHDLDLAGQDKDGRCAQCRRDLQVAAYAKHRAAILKQIASGEVTHCAKGHPLTVARINTRGECRLCRSERWRALHPPNPKLLCRNKLHPRIPENRTKKDQCRLCINANQRERKAKLHGRKLEEYREAQRIWANGRRRKQGVPERQWTEGSNRGGGSNRCVPSAPLVAWLEAWLAEAGVSMSVLSRRAGYTQALSLSHLRRFPTVQVKTVGRVLDAAGCPDQWHALYPTEDGAEIPLLLAAKRVPRSKAAATCRSGDGCARQAGHGPNGRFCEVHGDELDRIASDLNLALTHKQTHYARGRVAGGRASADRHKVMA